MSNRSDRICETTGLPWASINPVMTSCCPSRAVGSPAAATLRMPPVAASISISIDSLRSWRPRAASPLPTAGGRPRSASFGTHAKPNAGKSTTAQTPSSVNWAARSGPSGRRSRAASGKTTAARRATFERIDHEVAGAMAVVAWSLRRSRVPTISRGEGLRPNRFDSAQRGCGLVMTARLDQVFDFLERGQSGIVGSVAAPAEDERSPAPGLDRPHRLQPRPQPMVPGQPPDRLALTLRHRLRQVGRLIKVGLRAERLVGAVGQVEKVVERRPAPQHGRITGGPAQVEIPGGDRLGPVHQGNRADMVVLHRRRHPPGQEPSLRGRSAAIGGRSRLSRLLPSGPSQSRLVSARIGNRPASKPMWSAYRNPNRLAICGS